MNASNQSASNNLSSGSLKYLVIFLLLLPACATRSLQLSAKGSLKVVELQNISLPKTERSEDAYCLIYDFTNTTQVLIECNHSKKSEIVEQHRYTWSPDKGLTHHSEIDSRAGRWFYIQHISDKGEIYGIVDTTFGSVQFILKNGLFEYPYSPLSQSVYKATSPNGRSILVERGSEKIDYFLIHDGKEELLPLDGYRIDTVVVNDNGDCAGSVSKIQDSDKVGEIVDSNTTREPELTERGFVLLRGTKPVILSAPHFSRFDYVTNDGAAVGIAGDGPIHDWILYTKDKGVTDLRDRERREFSREYSFPSFVGNYNDKFLITEKGSESFFVYDYKNRDLINLTSEFSKTFPDRSLSLLGRMNDNFEFVGIWTSKNDNTQWEFFFAKLQGISQ